MQPSVTHWRQWHIFEEQSASILNETISMCMTVSMKAFWSIFRSSWHRIINAFVTWWDKWRSSTLIFKDRWINVLSLPSLSFKITLQFIWHRNPKFNLWSLKDVSVFWEHETDGPDVLNSMPSGTCWVSAETSRDTAVHRKQIPSERPAGIPAWKVCFLTTRHMG